MRFSTKKRDSTVDFWVIFQVYASLKFSSVNLNEKKIETAKVCHLEAF